MSNNDPHSLVDYCKQHATELTAKSGEIIKSYFRSPQLSVETKADASPVTLADQQAELAIREAIHKHFPTHGIIGEEFPAVNPHAEFQWIIDPIDGTKSFIGGCFDFGTIIGLRHHSAPIFGIIHQPILNELYVGDNEQTTLNGKAITARGTTQLSAATLLTNDFFNLSSSQALFNLHNLAKQVKFCRTWGNCYAYGLLALGYADIALDPIMKLWDIAGLIPVVRGAGAVITDYQGNDPIAGTNIIAAATPELHQRVMEILQRI